MYVYVHLDTCVCNISITLSYLLLEYLFSITDFFFFSVQINVRCDDDNVTSVSEEEVQNAEGWVRIDKHFNTFVVLYIYMHILYIYTYIFNIYIYINFLFLSLKFKYHFHFFYFEICRYILFYVSRKSSMG
jgi:hypothetical protein